jgi:hypothetical protein
MPEIIITAPESKKGIGWIRGEIGDRNYELFKTEDELFDKWNDAISDICRDTKCLNTDVTTDMIPGQAEYTTLNLVDTVLNIIRIDKIEVIDSKDTAIKKLQYMTRQDFEKMRREKFAHTRDKYTTPHFYAFDGSKLYIWKPYDQTGFRLKIYCVRVPLESERVWYEKDPVDPVKMKYLRASLYGAVYNIIGPRKDLQDKLDASYYLREFMKYKVLSAAVKSSEPSKPIFNELNL